MHELAAVLEDISPHGGCLQVESPVPENTVVQIRHGHQWGMVCRTVYCEYREIGYFIGLEFPEGEFWSKSAFNPQHLLNLTELMMGLNRRAVN